MALGFTTSSNFGSLNVLPDKGMTRKATPQVRRVNFGDGYEQRTTYGINSVKEEYNVSFKNRTRGEIENIAGFLKGVTSFIFTVPDHSSTEEVTGVLDSTTDDEKSIRVVCDSFNENYQYEDFYTLTAVFRRVYE
jgi:phage-related protein